MDMKMSPRGPGAGVKMSPRKAKPTAQEEDSSDDDDSSSAASSSSASSSDSDVAPPEWLEFKPEGDDEPTTWW